MRVSEFFQDSDRRMSMTRLLMFLSFFPASYVVICDLDSETLGWYLSAYAAAYGLGKFADRSGNATTSTKILETTSIESGPVDSGDDELPARKKPVRAKTRRRAF